MNSTLTQIQIELHEGKTCLELNMKESKREWKNFTPPFSFYWCHKVSLVVVFYCCNNWRKNKKNTKKKKKILFSFFYFVNWCLVLSFLLFLFLSSLSLSFPFSTGFFFLTHNFIDGPQSIRLSQLLAMNERQARKERLELHWETGHGAKWNTIQGRKAKLTKKPTLVAFYEGGSVAHKLDPK